MHSLPSPVAWHRRALLLPLLLGALLSGCSDRLRAPAGTDSGGGGGGSFFEGEQGPPHPSLRLTSVVPGVDRLRIEWTAVGLGDGAPSFGLFLGVGGEDPLARPPVAVDPSGEALVLEGLPAGAELRVALALADGAGGWVATRPALSARTRTVVYADPNSTAANQNGASPDSAYSDLFLAVIDAFAQGGGNVWLGGGTFENVSLPLFDGVDLYGGFGPGFDLAQRDAQGQATLLRALPGNRVLELDQLLQPPILDGLRIDGLGTVESGVDLDRTSAELRGLRVRGCERGVKLRTPEGDDPPELLLAECDLFENNVGGLSLQGPADLVVSGCAFRDNGGEGLDGDDWIAPPGVTVRIRIQDSRFLRNGTEGLDLDLAAPGSGGPQGGTFELELVDCDFADNGADGALIDLETEADPAWRARLVLRGLRSSRNAGHGMRLDLDGRAAVVGHRLVCSVNGGDGLLATSESQVGLLTVSASAFLGNEGSGVRSALGNYGLALSHSVLIGNQGGGVRGDTLTALVHSSVAYLQPHPWTGAIAVACTSLEAPDPLAFFHAPTAVHRVLGAGGEGLRLDPAPEFGTGTLLELDDDGQPREAKGVGVDSVGLDPEPTGAPQLLLAFNPSNTVDEDYGLPPGSALRGAGVQPPDGPPLDQGPFGARLAGAPGEEDLRPAALLHPASLTPPWGTPLADGATLRVELAGGPADPALASRAVLRSLATGASLPASVVLVAGALEVTPLQAWPAGAVVLELHPAGVADAAQPDLPAALVLPVR